MGKKSRLKKEFRSNTTEEERRKLKADRRERINAKESQVEWLEKRKGKPQYGYIAVWKDKTRYVALVKQSDGSLKKIVYPPLERGTFGIKDRA